MTTNTAAGKTKASPADTKKEGLPTWATIIISIITAVVGALGTLIPSLYKISVEQNNSKVAQEQVKKLEAQPGKTATADGRYEWQWAGEGWKGYISVDNTGAARIEMLRYMKCGDSVRIVPLLEQKGNGKIELLNNSEKMRVSIPVQFINYDSNCNRVGTNSLTTLRGDIDRKVAYAGLIEYANDYGAPLGDMILVKDYSSGVH